jgi:hypothetical protein
VVVVRKLTWVTGSVVIVAGLSAVSVFATAGAKTSHHPPPATTGAPTTVVLTNSSNGSTVTAHKGDRVVVRLTGVPLRWSEATAVLGANATEPVLVKKSGSTSANGSSTTTFRVANYGDEGINAVGAPICSAAMACPAYELLWHATVSVPVVDPPGGS